MNKAPALATTVALGASLIALAPGPSRAAPPAVERPGVYVVAEDVGKSAAFYERVFGAPPQVRTKALVGFDVAGALYAVVSREAYAPDARLGGNVVPYLKVRDIEGWFTHVRSVAPDSLVTREILREGPVSLFKFRDIDGNLVEMFAVDTSR